MPVIPAENRQIVRIAGHENDNAPRLPMADHAAQRRTRAFPKPTATCQPKKTSMLDVTKTTITTQPRLLSVANPAAIALDNTTR